MADEHGDTPQGGSIISGLEDYGPAHTPERIDQFWWMLAVPLNIGALFFAGALADNVNLWCALAWLAIGAVGSFGLLYLVLPTKATRKLSAHLYNA